MCMRVCVCDMCHDVCVDGWRVCDMCGVSGNVCMYGICMRCV